MENVQDILKKSVEYVQATQPLLEKEAAAREAFTKRANETVAVLVNRGIIDETKKAAAFDRLASDHAYALVLLEKIAGIVGADQLGAPSNITKVSEAEADPFVREYMPHLVSNKSNLL
jgi:hypothetical protein